MNKKIKKYALYALPLLVGGYLIYKQFARGSKNNTQDALPPQPPSPLPTPSRPSSPSAPDTTYPLQKGSKNASVGSLQTLLNTALQCQNKTLLVADNNFGSKTEAALMALTNKSSVKSYAEFEEIKKALASSCKLSANLDWGWKLIAASDSGKFTNLAVKTPVTLYKVNKDFTGKWVPQSPNKFITLAARSDYKLNDYKLRAATTDGKLRIEIVHPSPTLSGMYITDGTTDLVNAFNIL
jgi:hypothetical protein